MKNSMLELADRRGIGNMKGVLEERYAQDPKALFLSGAEMDFKTAPAIRKRLCEIAENGLYGFTCEEPEYLDAVCGWMKKTRNLSLSGEDVIPTHGTVFSLGTALRAFTGEGDGVILQAPSYYRFDRVIGQNKRRVIYNPFLEKEAGYQVDFADLEEKMADPDNRLLVLCNPHNPTGKVFLREELQKIAELSEKYGVIVFADEIFGEFTFVQEGFVSYLAVSEKNAIVSTSLGKAFNFTGVNHANMLIRDGDVKKKYLEQRARDHFGSLDPFFYNAVLAGYSREGYEWISQVKEQVQKNCAYIKAFAEKEIPALVPSPVQGGFTVWMDCRQLGLSDEKLQAFMEKEAHVIGDPGIEYGAMGKGFYRFQIATSEERIRRMMGQLAAAVRRENIS